MKIKRINFNGVVMKDMLRVYAGNESPRIIYTKDEYEVVGKYEGSNIVKVVDNLLIHSLGCCLASAQKSWGGSYMIVTDDVFNKCPRYVKEFIVNHEIGHIKLGHLETTARSQWIYLIKRAFGGKTSKAFMNELAADQFSAAEIGYDKALHALGYMANHFNLGTIGNAEIRKRMRHIQRLMSQ